MQIKVDDARQALAVLSTDLSDGTKRSINRQTKLFESPNCQPFEQSFISCAILFDFL